MASSETSKLQAQWWLNWALNFLKVTRSKCRSRFEPCHDLNVTGSKRSIAVSVPFVQTTRTSLMTSFNHDILSEVSVYGTCHFLKRKIKITYGKTLLVLQVHLSSPPVFSGVRVTQSLLLCVCFVDRCLFCCYFSFGHCVVCSSSFGHCVVCSSSIYGFWLSLWYLQTLLNII